MRRPPGRILFPIGNKTSHLPSTRAEAARSRGSFRAADGVDDAQDGDGQEQGSNEQDLPQVVHWSTGRGRFLQFLKIDGSDQKTEQDHGSRQEAGSMQSCA
jgi:hypothetical protein